MMLSPRLGILSGDILVMKRQPPNQGFLITKKIRSLLCHWTIGGREPFFYPISSLYVWKEMPPDEYDT